MQYLNFDVRIRRDAEGYVAIASGPAGEGSHHFEWPFEPTDLDRYLAVIGRPRSRSSRKQSSDEVPHEPPVMVDELATATDFGRRLVDAVFDGDVAERLAASHLHATAEPDRGLRIRLRLSEVPELQPAPWEFAWKDDLAGFPVLSRETPIVRYLDRSGAELPSLLVEPPLRILLMVSSPSHPGLAPLDVELEQEQLREALAPLREHVRIDVLTEASLDALQDELRRTEYHVFHYIGHSGVDPATGVATLALEDAEGGLCPARGDQLMVLLRDHPSLRLVVLNSCDGARNATDDPFAGIAHSLVMGGLPAVIAMQFEISDAAAIMFAQELYEALAAGDVLDQAVAEARKRIYNSPLDGTEWGTPVLFMRVPDGQLFTAPAADDETAASTDDAVDRLDTPTGGRPDVEDRRVVSDDTDGEPSSGDGEPPSGDDEQEVHVEPVTLLERMRSWYTPSRAAGFVAALVGLVAGVLGIISFFDAGNTPPRLPAAEPVTARSGEAVEIDLLSGVRDDGDVDELSVRPNPSSVRGATLAVLDDGRTVRYGAPARYVGADEFGYVVVDGEGATTAGVFPVTVQQGGIVGAPAVAVAPLASIGSTTAGLAATASQRIGDQVAAAFERSPLADSFGIADPDEMAVPVEDAAATAGAVGADVLIHGAIADDGFGSTIELRFYLSPDELTNATELANDYALATIESDASGSLALIDAIDARLPHAMDALTSLIEGVNLFNQNRFDEAATQLRAAEADWPRSRTSSNGREAVLMLLGNVELERNDLDAAAGYYEQSLHIAEDAGRPRFGLAETVFLRARGPKCGGPEPFDESELREAAREFTALSSLAEDPPFTAPRARNEVGRIALCMHLTTGSGLDEAEQAFTDVIVDYGGEPSLREIVAEAHQRRAFTHELLDDPDAAVQDYLAAIDLLRGDDGKEGRWHHELARIHRCELGDESEADYHDAESDVLLGEDALPRHDCEEQT